MSAFTRRLFKLFRFTRRQHGLVAMAALELARARFALARIPAKEIIAELQDRTAPASRPEATGDVAAISWAVRTAAAGVPWRSDCLVQSLAASRWLKREGVMPEFRLGVTSSADGSLRAHAWLELDGVVLTGGEDVADYAVLLKS